MELSVGMQYTAETVVDKGNVASAVGSGLLEVFATPMMVALMELAASSCIQPGLDEGATSVGTAISIQHSSATPVGMKVSATATVTAVDGRKVEFAVAAADECGEIGRGTHTRFVVMGEKFQAKTDAKGK